MHDTKSGDRAPVHYTMKTSTHTSAAVKAQITNTSQSHHSHATRHPKPSKTTTPIASPRTPYSVGQNYAPKLSPARQHEPRAPSPNYFGLIVESPADPRESSGLGRNNWSPPSSSIKSFGAAIPAHIPLDANPEFEAFKRQVDINKGRSFSPSTLGNGHLSLSNPPVRPRPSRWNTHASDAGSGLSLGRSPSHVKEKSTSKPEGDQDSLHDSAYVSSDSKRNSESSLLPLQLGSLPRFDSPQQMEGLSQRTTLTRSEDRDPRLSLMEHRTDPPAPAPGLINRASTLPAQNDNTQPEMITGDKLKDMIKQMDPAHLLLLDIRSAQNYAHSRIKGALNLCVPTTLLKRATFNIQKLQQTFSSGPNSEKFSKWRETRAIVVYDSHASNMKDAATAQNMLKKFTSENYTGETCILRGGFSVFQETYPKLIDTGMNAQPAGNTSQPGQKSGLAPVIGGVMLPMTSNAANPFFSNIRQNMDLADGVGQYDVSRPTGLQSPSLPTWLRQAASVSDKGKAVSEKFLHIEKGEKVRMQDAYAQFDPKTRKRDCVELSGVEKGGKNRYKDILPFEHARVKLQNRPAGACDYINASHVSSARSNKRYIAAQGPLPATFEDFWSVVWEQDVRVIVMLTAESEGGQVKCHSYWKDRQFGPIRLKSLSEKKASLDIDKHRSESTMSPASSGMSDHTRRRANTTTTLETPAANPQPSQSQSETPFVTIRKFALSHAEHPFAPMREITHLHFPAWPDFGTPAQPAHLLALIELANVMQRAALPVETSSIVGGLKTPDHSPAWYDEAESNPRARPMLVHCSAGCGRTGTFCAVDSVIDMLKRQRQAKHAASHTLKPRDMDGDITMEDTDGAVSPLTDKQMQWPTVSNNTIRRANGGSEHIDTGFLKDDTVDLIQSTVEDFRTQRLSMVQSLRQFVLCYETILEWVHRINDRSTPHLVAGRARSGSLQQLSRDRVQ